MSLSLYGSVEGDVIPARMRPNRLKWLPLLFSLLPLHKCEMHSDEPSEISFHHIVSTYPVCSDLYRLREGDKERNPI
jgi:hypothetical protein